jgi:hypothetical protein
MKHKCLTDKEIDARAYQIHLESGRRHGHDLDDWLQAEYELMHMSVGELAKLTVPKTSKAQREAKSIIEAVRTAML